MTTTNTRRPDVAPQATSSRRKVDHLYWGSQLDAARALGLAVVSMCGRNTSKPLTRADEGVIEVVGGLVPLTEKRHCQHCVRVVERTTRERWEAGR